MKGKASPRLTHADGAALVKGERILKKIYDGTAACAYPLQVTRSTRMHWRRAGTQASTQTSCYPGTRMPLLNRSCRREKDFEGKGVSNDIISKKGARGLSTAEIRHKHYEDRREAKLFLVDQLLNERTLYGPDAKQEKHAQLVDHVTPVKPRRCRFNKSSYSITRALNSTGPIPRLRSPARSVSREHNNSRFEPPMVEPLSPFHRIEQMIDKERTKLSKWQRVRHNINSLMSATALREE